MSKEKLDYVENEDDFVHIPDGQFEDVSKAVVKQAEIYIRSAAKVAGDEGAMDIKKPLCAGCLAALAHNVVVLLSEKNPQHKGAFLRHLARKLKEDGENV